MCEGGRGRLCTHAPRPCFAMVSEMGACRSTKCTSMKAIYGAISQLGRIVPVPFADLLDPRTGCSRVRQVDVGADSYANAFALQERISAEDLEDPARLASIAEAAKLSPDEARERYALR